MANWLWPMISFSVLTGDRWPVSASRKEIRTCVSYKTLRCVVFLSHRIRPWNYFPQITVYEWL